MKPSFNRHTLVWFRAESRVPVSAQITDDALRAHVAAWLAADRPLVVARQPDNLAPETISVGLALPSAQGKCRIAFSVSGHDIARFAQPLLFSDAIVHAPSVWQTPLSELDAAAMEIGIELRVFGSLAWQALSGMPYLTPRSDIDLLWHPRSNKQLQQGIALLERWEHSSGLRADGEILFGTSCAVSWREWAGLKRGEDLRVLVKREHTAGLVDKSELLEMLA